MFFFWLVKVSSWKSYRHVIFFILGDWCNGLKVDWGIHLCNLHAYVYVHNLIDEIELQPSVVWFSIGMIQRIVFLDNILCLFILECVKELILVFSLVLWLLVELYLESKQWINKNVLLLVLWFLWINLHTGLV